MRRCRIGLALALAGLAVPAAAQAQSFTILTQNVLRFGHGSRLQAQCTAINTVSQSVDIIVLQEVMAAGYPCLSANNSKGVNGALPTDFAYATSGAKGRSSYIEYYGILYRTTKRNNQQITLLEEDDALSTTTTFMRPPYAARFRVTDSSTSTAKSCDVWIVDIHSIFGKKVSERQGEAAAMEGLYKTLMGRNKGSVIVAGDWNLPADDTTGFGWVSTNNALIQPNVLTSLTATGAPSSAYDHAINTSNSTTPPSVTLSSIAVYYGGFGVTMPQWRANVSDHMGVTANVSLTC